MGYQPPPSPPVPPPGAGPSYPVSGPDGSGFWKYLALGCGCLLLLGVVGGAASCGVMYYKGSEIMSSLLRYGKPDLMSKLSDEHSPEERKRVERALDSFIDEIDRLGFIGFVEHYEEEFREMQWIMSDDQITLEESQSWCEHVEQAVESAPQE